jgi:hypothetical protein
MKRLAKIDRDLPAFLRDIDSHIDRLTDELGFGISATHGRPPFGCGILLVDTTIYSLETRLTLF